MRGALTGRVLRATACALAGLAAGGGLVLAHGGDPSRIHACMRSSDARVRITTADDDCSPDQPFDWNVRSAEGLPGPDGPAGAPGPEGPAGGPGRDGSDSRLAVRVVVAASPWVSAGARSVEAHCRPGEFAVSGGWRIIDPSGIGEFRPRESRPLSGGRGWRVGIDGWYAYKRWRLVVRAVCTPQGSER